MKFKPIKPIVALSLCAFASCDRDKEIKVYRVERETPAAEKPAADPHAGVPGMSPGAMAEDPHAGIPGFGDGGSAGDPHAGLNMGGMPSVGSRPKVGVEDSAPAEWKRREPSALRQLSYQLDGEEGTSADISLIILRGAAGRDLDNINRWREEQGLGPIDQAALDQSVEKLTTPAGSAVAVDIEGLPEGADPLTNGRLVAAIVTRGDDGWFFRMRGNAELTAAHKQAFLEWVKSVKPVEQDGEQKQATTPPVSSGAAGAEPPCCPPDEKTATHADHPSVAGTAGGGKDGRVTWQTPDGWTPDPNASTMRYATLVARGAGDAKAELAVTHFPGDVGGDLDNVNRWRGQIGLPPVTAAELPALVRNVTAGPKTLSMVDFSHNGQRLAAGWTRHGENTWFFKFSGPDAVVGAEMAKFTTLLESIRFHTAE